MRICKGLLLGLAVILLPGVLGPVEVQAGISISAPGYNTTWSPNADGSHLWSIAVTEGLNQVYRLDAQGNVLTSFFWTEGIISGLTWDGENIWLGEEGSGSIHQVSPVGTELRKVVTVLSDVCGLTWDGENLWAIDRGSGTIKSLTQDGAVLTSFPTPTTGGNPNGLLWDGKSFWFSDAHFKTVYQLNGSGEVLQQFTEGVPGSAAGEILPVQSGPDHDLVDARIEFRPSRWHTSWAGIALQSGADDFAYGDEMADYDGMVQVDEEEESAWETASLQEREKLSQELSHKKTIKCYIGNLRKDGKKYKVGDILVETVRLNEVVKVLRRDCHKCGKEDDDHGDDNDSPYGHHHDHDGDDYKCWEAKLFDHRCDFDGKVLRVKFSAKEAMESLGQVHDGDTVEVCVTGKLKNGERFKGCRKVIIVGNTPSDVVIGNQPGVPRQFKLVGNFPNPFNATTAIRFALPRSGQVHLAIYNVLGQKVRTLLDGHQSVGEKNIVWDGTDQNGNRVGSGVYYYRLVTDDGPQTGKMTLLK